MLSDMPLSIPRSRLIPRADYVRRLRDDLPGGVFEPARSRLALVPVCLAVVALVTVAIGAGWLPLVLAPLGAIAIGICFAVLTFIGHEAMHGGIVRGRWSRHLVGWLGFLPFTLSPRLWAAWHDRVHHANANMPDDPDMYPTLDEYRASRRIRIVTDAFALGGRRWRGGLSLILGFTVQSAHQLIVARRRGILTAGEHRWALAETALGIAVWATVAALVGGVAFLFVFVAPLLIANTIVMAFILTNHGLSPRVELNDPLVSSLTVTAPRWIEALTLKFGYHVEHHLFPQMSSRHSRRVHELLLLRWPQRYRSMPLRRALGQLHRTARVYKDAVTLIDPKTGREFATL